MSSKKKVAFFDIDGTVFRSAVMMEVVDRMIRYGMLPPEKYQAVVEARNAWKDRHGSFELYNKEFIHLMEHDFAGIPVKEFENLATDAVDDLKNHQYRYTRDLIEQLRGKDYVLVAISGSLLQVLQIYNRHLGFDDVYGSELAIEDGKFTDKVIGSKPYYDKAKAVQSYVQEHEDVSLDDSFAVGDTESDVGMLELVEHPIAFNPNRKLFEAADKHDWEIVVERKDMIYHLSDGRYNVDK